MLIGGTEIPIKSFNITGGNYGSTGSLGASTSNKALNDIGFDLVAASIASPGSLPVDVYESVSGAHLFSGEYLTGDYDYTSGLVSIHARDWSGPLVDQKRVLTSNVGGAPSALAPEEAADSKGVSTQNQKLSQVVTQIATQFSLVPDLRLGDGDDSDVGAQFGNSTDTIMTAAPHSLWGTLTRLARQSGNVVYVTPEKHLVFGQPGAGLDTLQFTWNLNVGPAAALPLEKLKIQHNPRRNLSFRVLVLSYDPTNQQMTKGEAYVVGSNYSAAGGTTIKAGQWGGAQAQAITTSIGTGKSSKKNAIPLYTFHADGLTAAQAQARATAIATDISKREIVATCEADLIPSMSPSQPATLSGDISQEFASHTYYVTGYSHTFGLRRGGSGSEFCTAFTLLDRQPAGTGKSAAAPEDT